MFYWAFQIPVLVTILTFEFGGFSKILTMVIFLGKIFYFDRRKQISSLA